MATFLLYRTAESDRNSNGVGAVIVEAADEATARSLAQASAPDGETEIAATWAVVEIAVALAATNPIYLTGDAASLTRFRGA